MRADELSLHYEPIVDARTLEVGGYEALLRWRRPGRGYADPATVIEVAEESGLIEAVGSWVRERALAEACFELTESSVVSATDDPGYLFARPMAWADAVRARLAL